MNQNEDDAKVIELKKCLREAGAEGATAVNVEGGVRVSWESGSRTIKGLSVEALCAHRWFRCSEDSARRVTENDRYFMSATFRIYLADPD